MGTLVDRFAVVLIAAAAMMWGTDTLFRIPLLRHLSPDAVIGSVQLVSAEHVILTFAVLPILWRARGEIRRLGRSRWAALIVIGAGASGLATVLFTLSFTYGHFIETLLLQKLQPLVALLLAALWLRERLPPRSYVWVPIAVAGAYLLAVPDPLHPAQAWQDFHVATALTAIGAAALWGAATVLGRYALADVRFPTVTALRFVTALPVLLVSLAIVGGSGAFGAYRATDLPLYLGLALIPGLVAMLLYYRGLASAPASMATLAELAFPITGVLVNVFLMTPRQGVTSLQLIGTVVLWIAIAALDLENARRPARIEPVERAGALSSA